MLIKHIQMYTEMYLYDFIMRLLNGIRDKP